MHREPRDTICIGSQPERDPCMPMHADTVDRHLIGAQWLERMGWTNDRAMSTPGARGPTSRRG